MSTMTGRRWPAGTCFAGCLGLLPGGDIVIKGNWTLLGNLAGDGTFVPAEYFADQLAAGEALPPEWAFALAELGARSGIADSEDAG